MSKTIKIECCNDCPNFSPFPAEFYDGDCGHLKANRNMYDTRISNKNSIPIWCPL